MFNHNKITGKDRRMMEEKIKMICNVENNIADDEINAIKESAYQDFMNSQNYRQQRIRKKEKRRTIATRLVAVVLVAIVLFVAPFAYSVLMPITMSKADQFMRSAAIWINEQFHLNIEFVVPPNDASNVQSPSPSTFQSLEELAQYTDSPIVCLPTTETVILDCITCDNSIIGYEQISIQYKINKNDSFSILISPLNSETTTILGENAFQLQTDVGTFLTWPHSADSQAVAYIASYRVDVYSSMPFEAFCDYCELLTVLN